MISKLRNDIFFESEKSALHAFFISKLEVLQTQTEILSDFKLIAESFLKDSYYSECAYKLLIYYGVTYGLQRQEEQLLTEVLSLVQQQYNVTTEPLDRFTLCVLQARLRSELFQLTQNVAFLNNLVRCLCYIEDMLKQSSYLKDRLGWDHLRSGNKVACISKICTAAFYKSVGKSFLALFRIDKEYSDLVKAHYCLSRAVEAMPCSSEVYGDCAEVLEELGIYLGSPNHLELAQKFFSRAIFLSFDRSKEAPIYQYYCCKYASVSAKLYELTFHKKYFLKANRILKITTQNFPHVAHLWIVWGDLLIHFGWLNRDVVLVEQGLEKLFIAKKKQASLLQLTTLFAQGLAVMGLLLEEPNFFKESRDKLLQVMKLFPSNHLLLEALGVTQLCYAIYFQEPEAFSSALACFSSYINTNPYNVRVLQKLFDACFAWAVVDNNIFLLKKALSIGKQVTKFCPYVFVYWGNLGEICVRLASVAEDLTVRETYLEQALFFFQNAWDKSGSQELLEPWAYTKYLLAVLREDESLLDEAYELLIGQNDFLPFTTLVTLANILLEKGRYSHSEGLIREALQILSVLFQSRPSEEQILVLLGKAWLYLFAETKSCDAEEQAKLYLQQAMIVGCEEAFFHLSRLYSIKNNISLSWKMAVRAIKQGFKLTKEEWLQDSFLDNVRMYHHFHEISIVKRA